MNQGMIEGHVNGGCMLFMSDAGIAAQRKVLTFHSLQVMEMIYAPWRDRVDLALDDLRARLSCSLREVFHGICWLNTFEERSAGVNL